MRKFIYIAFSLLVCWGCSEEIEFNLEDRNPNWLVVDGWVTTEPGVHQVFLSRSRDFSDTVSQVGVAGGDVRIVWDEGEAILSESGNGIYETDPQFALTPETAYLFQIQLGDVTYEYFSRVEAKVGLEIFDFEFENDSLLITLEIQGTSNERTYLVANLLDGEIQGNDTVWTSVFSGLNDSEIELVEFGEENSEEIDIEFPVSENQLSDLVRVEFHAFNEELFNYFTSLRQENEGELFSPNPANPEFLFSNGALGVVFNSAVTQVVLEME